MQSSNRHRRRWAAAALAAAAVASGLVVAAPATAAVLPNGFRSVGYMPSWSGSVNSVQYTKLTHINYAFALPNANGTLQAIPDPGKLSSLVSLGHSTNVKVSLAIGGWNDGNDSAFESLAANAGSRTTFVNQSRIDRRPRSAAPCASQPWPRAGDAMRSSPRRARSTSARA